MSLPEYIQAYNVPTGNSTPDGIITAIKRKVPNILDYVVPTSDTSYWGNISTVVTWDGYVQTGPNIQAYIQIEFKDRYVFATHYSLKGYGSNGWCYAKEWYLYGFDSVGETPTLITTNTSAGSTYCGSGSHCYNNNWGTFAIPNPNKSYRFLRIKIKTLSYCSNYGILLGGFEVFGTYSRDIRYASNATKRAALLFKSCPAGSNYPIPIIFKTIFICS
jgi:hypothetical protein